MRDMQREHGQRGTGLQIVDRRALNASGQAQKEQKHRANHLTGQKTAKKGEKREHWFR